MNVFGNFWRNYSDGIGEKVRRSVGEDLSVAQSFHGRQFVFRRLSQRKQLQLMAFLSDLDFENTAQIGKFKRDDKTLYRLRWQDLRIYFECAKEDLFIIHYLLPKHTWNDFLLRANLPLDEDAIEKDERFWKFLEKL